MRIRFATSTLLAGLALVWQASEPAAGQAAAPASDLSIAAIMARDWIGTPPEDPYWSGDGKSIYYRQRRAGSDVVDLYRTEVASGRTERVPPRSSAESRARTAPGRAIRKISRPSSARATSSWRSAAAGPHGS